MIFELRTGDYLFDPKPTDEYPRDEDHLALCFELLGPMPKNMMEIGRDTRTYFNSRGELRHIKSLRHWALADVCQQKYHMNYLEAQNLASFLLPMLCWDPTHRATASEMLQHPWLRGLPAPELEELFHPERPLAPDLAAMQLHMQQDHNRKYADDREVNAEMAYYHQQLMREQAYKYALSASMNQAQFPEYARSVEQQCVYP